MGQFKLHSVVLLFMLLFASGTSSVTWGGKQYRERIYLYPVPRFILFLTVLSNIIGLPERRNKRKSVLEITKNLLF